MEVIWQRDVENSKVDPRGLMFGSHDCSFVLCLNLKLSVAYHTQIQQKHHLECTKLMIEAYICLNRRMSLAYCLLSEPDKKKNSV